MHASALSAEDSSEGSVNTAVKKSKGMCKTSAKDAEEDSMRLHLQRNTVFTVDRSCRTALHIALVAEESSQL